MGRPHRRPPRPSPVALFTLAFVLSLARLAPAQDPGSFEQLRRMYDETLEQLKTAQDRKNHLAGENERLQARVKELEEHLATSQAKVDHHQRESASTAEKTFFLRAHYAAWQLFLDRHPDLVARWRVFLGDGLTLPKPNDPDREFWPLGD